MNGSRVIDLGDPRGPEAECRAMLLRGHIKTSGWKVTDEVVKAVRATRHSPVNALPSRGPLPPDLMLHKPATPVG